MSRLTSSSRLATCVNAKASPWWSSSCGLSPCPIPPWSFSSILSFNDLNLKSSPMPSRLTDAAHPSTVRPIQTPRFLISTMSSIGFSNAGCWSDALSGVNEMSACGDDGECCTVMCPDVPFHFAGKATGTFHRVSKQAASIVLSERKKRVLTVRSVIVLGPRLVEDSVDLVSDLVHIAHIVNRGESRREHGQEAHFLSRSVSFDLNVRTERRSLLGDSFERRDDLFLARVHNFVFRRRRIVLVVVVRFPGELTRFDAMRPFVFAVRAVSVDPVRCDGSLHVRCGRGRWRERERSERSFGDSDDVKNELGVCRDTGED